MAIGVVVVGVVACLAAIGYGTFTGNEPRKELVDQTRRDETESSVPLSGEPGPTERIDGMPAGFAHSEQGAIAAAAAFATNGPDLLAMDPLAMDEAVHQISSDAFGDELSERIGGHLRRLREVLAPGTGPLRYWEAALAVNVESFERDRARVAVWVVGVLSREAIAAPQAGWSVATLELVWERGDWRVEGSDANGPAPINNDAAEAATSAELAERLDGFVPLLPGPPTEGGR